MPRTNEVIVFAKAPRRGFVKTRLAREIGPGGALEIYRTLLRRVPRTISGTVCFAPADGWPELERYFPGWRFRAQCEGDLGARLFAALLDSFARGALRTVIIGADCPYVNTDDLIDAWNALESSDVVFGPAEDGGYWLVGARRVHEDMFEGIAWGGSEVLEQNMRNCARLGLSVHLLRTLPDVDTRADWRRYLAWRRGEVTLA